MQHEEREGHEEEWLRDHSEGARDGLISRVLERVAANGAPHPPARAEGVTSVARDRAFGARTDGAVRGQVPPGTLEIRGVAKRRVSARRRSRESAEYRQTC